MKLATFLDEGHEHVGLVVGGGLVALDRVAPALPRTMIDLIAAWPQVRDAVAQAATAAPTHRLDHVRLLAPVPRPRKMMAIGLNYADHVAETGMATPVNQLWFAKQTNAVNGPFDPVDLPRVSEQLDWEAELVAIMGPTGRHVPVARARDHVFGYCVGNDVSVRDVQMQTPQWILGKSFDTHAPFGPWITTADEVGDPHRLGIRTLVNGALRQNSNTTNLIFRVEDQVARLSQVMTLEAGDVLFTGTPGGVALGMKPPVWLKAGDRVRVEIDELGAIEAEIRPEP
ncbi:fumarylacetoacetate hydrolase family protein [Zavarzinia sp. CC-PAN008]|uniref:fumarylacetoacetate hydrolase family protein n=1 Tax=Zavarzinia sp. CC-PAN008 TaxID=3243332 RepID=UPI003F743B63